ncbi:MAG: alkaline phosphatase family protein [Candidatus Heimdallarchaeota archaeon]
MSQRKMLVIGLDCASPRLIFEDFKAELPHLDSLMGNGLYGNLRSSMPPITVPAWMVMYSGLHPGKFGLYGFRHRKNTSYTDIWIATPRSVQVPKIWDILAQDGRKSCVFAVPPGYPPPPINGWYVSCFLTPSSKSPYTHPSELKTELEAEFEPYIPDIDYRSGDRDNIKIQLFKMLDNHMQMIKYLIRKKPWHFFALVEIGVDRVHHAFWRFHDRSHHLHEPNSPYKHVIRDYYKAVDKHIGEILNLVDDDTYILVASDHGVKSMKGAFCINEWLVQEGYLVLNEKPSEQVSLSKANIDWDKSKAWGWGGYYSRVFLNVKGREEKGVIDPKDFDSELETLRRKLLEIPDNNGHPMENLVIRPDEYYSKPIGDYPDLMVIFDDLRWRAAGTLGHASPYLLENDIGSDDAMHDWNGMYILYDPKQRLAKGRVDARIEDIAPTI